ncbi:MAG TPA: dihydroorotate dehydrogenase [Terriglobales bacterium]|nr:dihydroorotate dehydrogenase [Terriglobales bacterium]
MTASPATERRAPDLSVSFAGIQLKNPVIAASGTFGYGIEFEDVVHLDKLGGFVVKGLSREPMAGNPPPRLYETPAGMLNAIGLQNIGARAFIDEKLPKLREMKNIVVFANVFGYTREDYERAVEILNEGEGIAAYELNVSCPNTTYGGIQFGSDPRSLDEVVSTVRRHSQRPLIVKLSPNVTSIAQMAHVAQEAGADAVSLVNTFVAMAIDAETRKPRIANVTAGLSGPAIKPIALRMVYDASKAVKIPVIGMGGISTAVDIVEFMLAGATAVQIGTASYWDPVATEKIVAELQTWCAEHNVERLADLTGGMVME